MITLRSEYYIIEKNESRADILRDFKEGETVYFEFEFKAPGWTRRGTYASYITIVNDSRAIKYKNTLNKMARLLEKIKLVPERW